jgi:hypothetical protein
VFGALLLLLVVEECLEQNVVRWNPTWHQLCGGVECIVPYVEIWYKNLTYKNARKQNLQKVEPKKKFIFLPKIQQKISICFCSKVLRKHGER